MLLCLLGSKSGLSALISRARADELEAIRQVGGLPQEQAGVGPLAPAPWRWLSSEAHRALLRLWVGRYSRSLNDPDGPWAGFARDTVGDWMALPARGQPGPCATPRPRSCSVLWSSPHGAVRCRRTVLDPARSPALGAAHRGGRARIRQLQYDRTRAFRPVAVQVSLDLVGSCGVANLTEAAGVRRLNRSRLLDGHRPGSSGDPHPPEWRN